MLICVMMGARGRKGRMTPYFWFRRELPVWPFCCKSQYT